MPDPPFSYSKQDKITVSKKSLKNLKVVIYGPSLEWILNIPKGERASLWTWFIDAHSSFFFALSLLALIVYLYL